MKVIIAGGRDYKPTETDRQLLRTLAPLIDEVVSGGAKGADAFGERFAVTYKKDCRVFPADWDKWGRVAGPMRNREMAKYADLCILFPGGTGTNSMFCEASAAGIPILDLRRGWPPKSADAKTPEIETTETQNELTANHRRDA